MAFTRNKKLGPPINIPEGILCSVALDLGFLTEEP